MHNCEEQSSRVTIHLSRNDSTKKLQETAETRSLVVCSETGYTSSFAFAFEYIASPNVRIALFWNKFCLDCDFLI